MELLNFKPENPLEFAIVSAKEGNFAIDDLVNTIAESLVFVSSKKDVGEDGSGFDPLLVGDSGSPLVSVFSSLSRPGLHRKMAEYVLQMKGADLFMRLPPGYGVAFNPGYVTQLVISRDVISGFKKI